MAYFVFIDIFHAGLHIVSFLIVSSEIKDSFSEKHKIIHSKNQNFSLSQNDTVFSLRVLCSYECFWISTTYIIAIVYPLGSMNAHQNITSFTGHYLLSSALQI